jgi:hypothetical protein
MVVTVSLRSFSSLLLALVLRLASRAALQGQQADTLAEALRSQVEPGGSSMLGHAPTFGYRRMLASGAQRSSLALSVCR